MKMQGQVHKRHSPQTSLGGAPFKETRLEPLLHERLLDHTKYSTNTAAHRKVNQVLHDHTSNKMNVVWSEKAL